MIPAIRYYAMTDENDEVTHLGRVIRDESGLWGQLLVEGEWIEEKVVLQCIFDPLFGEQIEEAEAAHVAHKLGGSL